MSNERSKAEYAAALIRVLESIGVDHEKSNDIMRRIERLLWPSQDGEIEYQSWFKKGHP